MADTEKTKVFLRELAIKVKNGVISKVEATKLAALAVSEVAKTPIEEPANAADETAPVVEEPKAADVLPSPAPSAVDPKSQLMALLTGLEQSYAAAWTDFQTKVTALIQGTEGAAIPAGDFSLGMGDSNVKFSVEQGDSNSAKCSYSVRKVWSIPNVVLPAPTVQASVRAEPSCHLPLRREILSRAEEVLEYAENELVWKKYKIPSTAFFAAREEAAVVNDKRLVEVLSAMPNSDRFAQAESWKKWATAAQVYLLGSDYVEAKEFSKILAETEVE